MPVQYFCNQISILRATIILIICFILSANFVTAQAGIDSLAPPPPDTLVTRDTVRNLPPVIARNDSVSKRPVTDSSWVIPAGKIIPQALQFLIMKHHPWIGFSSEPFTMQTELRQIRGKELLFYVIVGLVLLFALLRNAFPKYMADLFRLFFRTTIKQRQVREQLMQTPLPSLLLNGFFILTAGLYIAFVLRHYKIDPVGSFWLTALYCCLGLSVAYFIKFLGLKISGWLFNMQAAATSYIFIVFVVNKMIGIILLPFIVLLAFTTGDIYLVSLYASWFMLAGLIIYRFILTFAAIRNQVKVNPFHFLLYLCAFEIAPLLLVYKGLLLYFHETA